MAKVRTFTPRPDRFAAPASLSNAERTIWDDQVRRMRRRGTLSRTTPAAVRRYVKRQARADAVFAEAQDVVGTMGALNALLQESAAGSLTRRTLSRAILHLVDLEARLSAEHDRLQRQLTESLR